MNTIRNEFLFIVEILDRKFPFLIEYEDYDTAFELINSIDINELEYESDYDLVMNIPEYIVSLLDLNGINAYYIESFEETPISIKKRA